MVTFLQPQRTGCDSSAQSLAFVAVGACVLATAAAPGVSVCDEAADTVDRDRVVEVLQALQLLFVDKLEAITSTGTADGQEFFKEVQWLRNSGHNGGGKRYECAEGRVFNRASVNVSAVHYTDKAVKSASALSVILHPRVPHAPSMHFHVSLTEMKNGAQSWRMIADLNPSIPTEADTRTFEVRP
jgi:coproporphyrinogen III oxidase